MYPIRTFSCLDWTITLHTCDTRTCTYRHMHTYIHTYAHIHTYQSITNFIVNQPVNTYQCIKIGNCYGHKRKGPEGIKNPANYRDTKMTNYRFKCAWR